MNIKVIEPYIFNGRKLKMAIELKARSLNIPKLKIRNMMKLSLGISKQTLSLWERSQLNPSIDACFWLRDFFGYENIDQMFNKK